MPDEKMFCYPCGRVEWKSEGGMTGFDHHRTYGELVQSAKEGCKLCAVFIKAILLHYNLHHPGSTQSGEEYHQFLDAEENRGFNVTSVEIQVDYKHTDAYLPNEQSGLQGFRINRPKAWYAPNDAYKTCAMVSVSSQPGSDALLYRHIFGRQPASFPDLKLAKTWLAECQISHDQCPKSKNAQFPPRLLDLQKPDGDSSDLRLASDMKGNGMYATLSHCWGKSQPLRLLQANQAELEDNIAFSSLPRTFQDAVTVSRSLGLRYLWIDSLCILQDSLSDWEENCSQMARIYRDSYVTIAGPAASGCESGFLHPRQTSDPITVQLDDKELELEVAFTNYDVGGDTHCFWPERDSPLATRAWVLQERMLSGRTLYFGTSRMYLECHTNVRFEDCHYPIIWEDSDVNMVVKRPADKLERDHDQFRYWYALISNYSGLDITKRTDKLPALSGLASEFGGLTKYRYVAGHWQQDMPRSLAWYVPTEDKAAGRGLSAPASSTQYIAPSWSWASSPFRVKFLIVPGFPFTSMLEKLEVHVVLAGLDPRGMLKSGYIDVAGQVLHGTVKRTGITSAEFRASARWSPPDTMEWYWDDGNRDAANVGESEITVDLLYILQGEYRVCLIVEPVDGGKSYRRFGLVAERGNSEVFDRAFRTGSESKELRLI